MAVQVKRWKANIQSPVVQQVRGSLGTHEQGLIIITSNFSKGACDESERPDAVPVGLMNGETLVRLLVENDIGVTRRTHDLFELTEDEPPTITAKSRKNEFPNDGVFPDKPSSLPPTRNTPVNPRKQC